MNTNFDFDIFIQYLPFLIPLMIFNVTLAVVAIIHILKHPHYRFGNKVIWILIVLFVQLFGPILYFTIGRGDQE